MKKVLLVINSKSGLGAAKDFHTKLKELAEENNIQVEVYETTGKGDRAAIRQLISENKPDVVYAAGGDGTVNLVATELLNTGISLGIFPAGSANGLAYNLGITNEMEDVLLKYLNETPVDMDVIRFNNDYYCFHLADIGVNARIVSRFEKEGSRGMLGYGKHLLQELVGEKTWFNFYIEVPGSRRKKMKAEMLVFANAKSYGTGAMINPTGKFNDGRFEIIVLRPYPWWFVFTFIYAVFTGKLHRMKYIKVFSMKKARIVLVKKQEIQVDGEIIPDVKTIDAEILPGALKVLPGPLYKPEE